MFDRVERVLGDLDAHTQLLGDRLDEIRQRREVVVERARRDPGRGGDLADGRPVWTAGGQCFHSGPEQAVPRLRPLAGIAGFVRLRSHTKMITRVQIYLQRSILTLVFKIA